MVQAVIEKEQVSDCFWHNFVWIHSIVETQNTANNILIQEVGTTRKDETHKQNDDGTTARSGFGAINSTMEIGTEIRGALETAFIDRDAAQARERSEHLLQMRNSEARHEADMEKMATSLQAVTEALMAMKATPRSAPVPAM